MARVNFKKAVRSVITRLETVKKYGTPMEYAKVQECANRLAVVVGDRKVSQKRKEPESKVVLDLRAKLRDAKKAAKKAATTGAKK